MDIADKIDEMLYNAKLELIKNNPGLYFSKIKNPSEEMKLEAVKVWGNSLQWIQNPSNEVMLEAVKQEPCSIHSVMNPPKWLQLEAIKRAYNAIYWIKDPVGPSEEMKLEAIKLHPFNLDMYYEKGWATEEIVMEAIIASKFDPKVIVFVDLSKLSKENLETIYNNVIIKDIIE